MTTEPFHQKLAEQVFAKMTSARMTSFDERSFFKNLYHLLRRHDAMDGKIYHGRKIKPLVEKMFVELQKEQGQNNFVLT